MSRYQITAPKVEECLVSCSFHGEGVIRVGQKRVIQEDSLALLDYHSFWPKG